MKKLGITLIDFNVGCSLAISLWGFVLLIRTETDGSFRNATMTPVEYEERVGVSVLGSQWLGWLYHRSTIDFCDDYDLDRGFSTPGEYRHFPWPILAIIAAFVGCLCSARTKLNNYQYKRTLILLIVPTVLSLSMIAFHLQYWFMTPNPFYFVRV